MNQLSMGPAIIIAFAIASRPKGDVTGRGDEALTQWAAKAMPKAKQHLDHSRQIQQQVVK